MIKQRLTFGRHNRVEWLYQSRLASWKWGKGFVGVVGEKERVSFT